MNDSPQKTCEDGAALRLAATGTWIIHSAHFINIIMGETERGEREERVRDGGRGNRGMADVDVGGLESAQKLIWV